MYIYHISVLEQGSYDQRDEKVYKAEDTFEGMLDFFARNSDFVFNVIKLIEGPDGEYIDFDEWTINDKSIKKEFNN